MKVCPAGSGSTVTGCAQEKSSATYWSATSGEHESGYTFIFTHRYVNEREEDYYYGTPIRAVFSID